jgi:hypothetical protein
MQHAAEKKSSMHPAPYATVKQAMEKAWWFLILPRGVSSKVRFRLEILPRR